MIEPILTDIRDAVDKELRRAEQHESIFRSPHEGYGVLKEEMEEMLDEAGRANRDLADMWFACIRKDLPVTEDALSQMELNAMRTAAEAIQVAAMARKYGYSQSLWLVGTYEKKKG